jgi:uncharacterized protein YecT (DUF1311 family)
MPRLALLVALCALGAPAVARAQQVDCARAMAQQELAFCAEQDWMRADADLNAAYRQAMDALTAYDAELDPEYRGGARALKEAQRAWITYRDQGCAAEGFAMRGGSAETLVIYGCLARVTDQRAGDLWLLVESLGSY